MTITGLNFIGVLVAFVFSFVSSAIWFGPKTFYPVWMKARGIESGILTENQNKPAALFGGTIVALLVEMVTLGIIINSLQAYSETFGIVDGAGVGFALGLGISMASSLPHRLFGGEGFKVWIIETANDGINLMIAGAIIAYFN